MIKRNKYVMPAWRAFSWFLIAATVIPFSAISLSPGIAQAVTPVLFQDDFESGLSSWSPAGTVTTDDSSTFRRSCPGDFSGCGADGSNDYAFLNSDSELVKSISTTGYTDVTLSYWRRGINLSGGDRFNVEWRVGTSGHWTNLESNQDSTWTKKSFTISGSGSQSTIQIRLNLEKVESTDYAIFDDVQVTADQLQPPGISIDTLNGGSQPFNYSCPDNPPSNPVSITGSGAGSTPPGLIEQYKVQIDWGDGNQDNGLGSFTPTSGHGNFSFTYSGGPHTYASNGDYTITARLYHQTPPGKDGDAGVDAVFHYAICIIVPICGNGIKEGTEQCDGTSGVGDHQSCTQECTLVNVPYCGDGIKNGDEQCDGTSGVGANQSCTANCTLTDLPYCGDGIVNGDEACDAGPTGSTTCTPNCMIIPVEPACNPNIELVANGSFENPSLGSDAWNIFPQAQTSWATDWTTTTPSVFESATRPLIAELELQNGPVIGYTAADGSQYAELDGDWFSPSNLLDHEPASVRIHQDLTTVPGLAYNVKFSFSPRPGTDAANNQLAFNWDNVLRDTISADGSSNSNTSWINKEYTFTATASSTRLEFADVGTPSDSLGTLLDNVSVRCSTSTPTVEPVCGNGIKETGEQCDDGNLVNSDGCNASCQLENPACENITGQGWYGQYYNYSQNHPDMNLPMDQWPDNGHGDPLSGTWNTDWYTNPYFRFARVDSSLTFGSNFFPFDIAPEELDLGHEFHFGVHWSGIASVSTAGDYGYSLSSDDDSWVYVDGVLQVDNSGIHVAETKTGTLHLTGHNVIDIFYAERHTSEASFNFNWTTEGVTMNAYSNNCTQCGNFIKEGTEACDDGPDGSRTCSTQCTEIPLCNPDQELVINGSFEQPTVTSTALWDVFPASETDWLTEWSTTTPSVFNDYTRPETALMEIQRGIMGWLSRDGSQSAELDSDWFGPENSVDSGVAGTRISQEIPTMPGQFYKIKFSFSPRPGASAVDNQMAFSWDNILRDTLSADGSGNSNTVWTDKEYTFAAGTTTTRLSFEDIGTALVNRGVIIDSVSVRCTIPTEPICGNGIKEGTEQCDGQAGVTEGFRCTDQCTLEPLPLSSSICGYKWNDGNGNGAKDGEEQNLSNWTIQLVTLNACQENTEWANEVVSYNPGTQVSGSPVDPSRTDANQALGVAQNDDTNNFVALGFGGSLVLKFKSLRPVLAIPAAQIIPKKPMYSRRRMAPTGRPSAQPVSTEPLI